MGDGGVWVGGERCNDSPPPLNLYGVVVPVLASTTHACILVDTCHGTHSCGPVCPSPAHVPQRDPAVEPSFTHHPHTGMHAFLCVHHEKQKDSTEMSSLRLHTVTRVLLVTGGVVHCFFLLFFLFFSHQSNDGGNEMRGPKKGHKEERGMTLGGGNKRDKSRRSRHTGSV